jgi:cellulose synthase/poly-beta-1,6-N-acetylglucosamine synthase-like glycosyltransferase
MQLPIYNEKYVVSRLINSVCELDWPIDKLEIMVLDDSTDETSGIIDREVALKKKEGFDIKVVRRKERLGYKAGALQNALDQTKNEYIAIIDADFIPPRDFLEKTVSAIQIDPGIGFVQARWGHINRGYNRYTEAFAIAIDGYHIVEQSARSSTGLIMNFNGSAGLLRTQAIRESGGWSWDTLSEDMDLSYRIQMCGWSSLYLRDLPVSGELPPTLNAFRIQQGRWARGSVQCARKLLAPVWRSGKSLTQKIEATLHLTYYTISLWMWLSLLVTVPLLALNRFPYINNPVLLALFSLAGISTFTLYIIALRSQKLSLFEKWPYAGILALMMYGISAKVSIEMIKGFFRKGGDWIRVPKFNLIHPGQRIEGAYNTLRELPWLELVMAIYAGTGLVFAYIYGSYGILIYLLVYFLGYIMVAVEMVLESLT